MLLKSRLSQLGELGCDPRKQGVLIRDARVNEHEANDGGLVAVGKNERLVASERMPNKHIWSRDGGTYQRCFQIARRGIDVLNRW